MAETRLTIADDHPAYAGHFPGQPLVPAVVLLAEALAALGLEAHRYSVSQAKFLKPVVPGMPLTLAHESLEHGCKLEIRSGDGVVATATLEARAP
jgi:3-hydroxyacyl-[acyl-carrier-protein] dehydratase